MTKYISVLAILFTVGCAKSSVLQVQPAPPVESVSSVAQLPDEEVYPEGQLRPRRKIDELLVQRLDICGVPLEQRATVVSSLNVAPVEVDGVDEDLLNQLLVASCSPATTPGVLNQLLADLTSAGTWPEAYAAFFDLLISGQRAYAAVEKVYLDLKQEHEKTIQGLSEIETQIEKQNATVQQ